MGPTGVGGTSSEQHGRQTCAVHDATGCAATCERAEGRGGEEPSPVCGRRSDLVTRRHRALLRGRVASRAEHIRLAGCDRAGRVCHGRQARPGRSRGGGGGSTCADKDACWVEARRAGREARERQPQAPAQICAAACAARRCGRRRRMHAGYRSARAQEPGASHGQTRRAGRDEL